MYMWWGWGVREISTLPSQFCCGSNEINYLKNVSLRSVYLHEKFASKYPLKNSIKRNKNTYSTLRHKNMYLNKMGVHGLWHALLEEMQTRYFFNAFLFVSLASTGSSSNFHQISSFDFMSTNTLSEDSVVVVGKGILKLFSFLNVCFLHV